MSTSSFNEYRITGVVIKASDYKEKDKLITIFSLELGKITALLKGVNNAKSKLKYASQPFCFGVFELVRRGSFFIITQVSAIDNFFKLTTDYESFIEGAYMLKLCNYIKPNAVSERLFISFINCLKIMTYDNANNHIVVSKFVLEFLDTFGYAFDFNNCSKCEGKLNSGHISKMYGGLICDNCFNFEEVGLKKQEFALLKIINNTPPVKLKNIKVKDILAKDLLKFLKDYIKYVEK